MARLGNQLRGAALGGIVCMVLGIVIVSVQDQIAKAFY
jgi:hypothetical protein